MRVFVHSLEKFNWHISTLHVEKGGKAFLAWLMVFFGKIKWVKLTSKIYEQYYFADNETSGKLAIHNMSITFWNQRLIVWEL